MCKISAIVATDLNGIIGKDNKIPWNLPKDLKFFREKTRNSTVIMGRKTFDSIGKALPNRNNIIVTRNKNFTGKNVNVLHSIDRAIDVARELGDNIFIIGGGQIYQQSISYWDRIYWTKVNCEIDGDTEFPKINLSEWMLTKKENFHKDYKNNIDFSIFVYEKK